MEAIPSFKLFFLFRHRLGNIKVLSKLDPGRLIHWEIAGVLYIQCHITDSKSVDFLQLGWSPYVYMAFVVQAWASLPLNNDICCLWWEAVYKQEEQISWHTWRQRYMSSMWPVLILLGDSIVDFDFKQTLKVSIATWNWQKLKTIFFLIFFP